MKTSKSISRRNFIEKAAVTAGFTALGTDALFGNTYDMKESQDRLPREVWIATVSQQGLSAETPEKMVQLILPFMEKSLTYRPDVICLPEVFVTSNVEKKMTLSEKADASDRMSEKFTAFARANNCYVIYSVYTRENGKTYNSAVVIDRRGNRVGEYRKMHLTEGELEMGITPGPLQPPVFKTDFGIIGMQICFDNLWDDGWKALRRQGAEIVFWPSAYAGGQTINARAWQNKYIVVSSTRKDTSKICDIAGDVVAQTGIWDRNLICAPVNLEKVFLHTWPYVQRFDEIRAKYGRKVRIVNHHEEEWSIIESLSADVKVKDILTEFNLKTHEQLTHDSEILQNKARG